MVVNDIPGYVTFSQDITKLQRPIFDRHYVLAILIP